MKTTVDFDPDVARLLEQAVRERKTTMKEFLNTALRSVLRPSRQPSKSSPYVLRTRDLGSRQDILPSRVLETLEEEEELLHLRSGR